MPTPAALTIYAFGLTALGAGVSGLLDPAALASSLGLPGATCAPLANASALAATAMGIYYSLAAYQENTAFFVASVPMRLLTTFVFWRQGWGAAALWEGGGAVVTAGALVWGRVRGEGKGKGKRE
ncbi:hypothetical protein F5B20DRAFT_594974 [Whalleya microplaca]|nr:hypothetical protein F5B20DRAFT_594974 [Whalleya microplaca]